MSRNHATVALSAALLAAGAAKAQFIWFGDDFLDPNNFKNPFNWLNNVAPTPGFDLGGADFIFDTSFGVFGTSPDIGANTYLGIGMINFQGGGPFTYTLVGSGSFSFDSGGGIINTSSNAQTVNVALVGSPGGTLLITASAADLTIGAGITLADVLLVVDGSSNTTISGAIVGVDGGLIKQGSGTLTLSGNNLYDAGTELRAGTLQVGHNNALGTGGFIVTSGSLEAFLDARTLDNNVFINGMLTVSGTNNLTLNGNIFGGGGLVMNMTDDTDKLALGGTNGYTGGTTLAKGTLELASNSALGSGLVTVTGSSRLQTTAARTVSNAISLGAPLTVQGANDLTLAGVISGSSSLTMDFSTDGDRLTVSGNNMYSGGTTLTRGTLVVDHNNALGTGLVTVDGNATTQADAERVLDNNFSITNFSTLTVSGDHSLTLNGALSGSGGLTVAFGSADQLLRLSGASTYAGPTTVNGGELQLDGASLTSPVTVGVGAILSGSGSIAGNLVLVPLSTYRVMIDADTGTADLLDITGTATLFTGSTIVGSLTGAGYVKSGQTFPILKATGGIVDGP